MYTCGFLKVYYCNFVLYIFISLHYGDINRNQLSIIHSRTVQAGNTDINDPNVIGSFSNGAIHWIVRHGPDDGRLNKQREKILSFDVKDEAFLEMVLPNGGEKEGSGFWCLGDLKGCLYAVYGGDGVDMDVWVMKEYGVERSWSNVIKVDWNRIPCDYGMIPVCFTFTHEEDAYDVVLDLDAWNMVRCNLKENSIKTFKKCSIDWHFWVVYTETLVSPYG
ncbi:hypothetical protein R6Q59_016030 [Mikania micrantha]